MNFLLKVVAFIFITTWVIYDWGTALLGYDNFMYLIQTGVSYKQLELASMLR